MQSEVTISIIARLKSILLCTMFVFTAFSASLAGVQAVGANQNDFYQWWGTGYGDLPDDNISAQNSFPTFPYSYMAPHYSGLLTAELDVNDDEDWFSILVASSYNSSSSQYEAIEGLNIQISYSNTYTSPSNGTVYNNNFQINLYDWNMTLINTSSSNNPGFISTAGTTVTPGNCCGYYVQVIRNSGYGSYDTEVWVWNLATGGSGTGTQNDLNFGTDLPDTQAIATQGNYIASLNGMSPFYSGIAPAQLDVGDDEDWFAVTIDTNEGLGVQISYNSSYTSPTNGTTYTNEFDLGIFDSSGNQLDFSINNNPEYVTTNSSSISHTGTIYVQIIRYAGYGFYDLELWTWSTSGGGGGPTTQNDIGNTNYDLPDTYNDLQLDPMWPLSLTAAPLYSGILTADLDLNGDN